MKCPLLLAGYWSSTPGINTIKTDCLQKKCAWWDGRFFQCVIFTGAEALYNLRNDIKDIIGKMPHEAQFKK